MSDVSWCAYKTWLYESTVHLAWDGYSMFDSKIRNYVHPYALIAEVVGKRERGNDLVFQKYQR